MQKEDMTDWTKQNISEYKTKYLKNLISLKVQGRI